MSVCCVDGQIFIAGNAILYIVSADLECQSQIALGETSLVEVLSHDIIPEKHGLELLVSTTDGSVMCLGVTRNTAVDETHRQPPTLKAWLPSVKSANGFALGDSTKAGFLCLYCAKVTCNM